LVELGTHSGNSYFAFCQGIATHGGAGRAYAVDTWLGDEHAGFYGKEIFDDVRAFNDAQFSGISTLLRARFEDARPYFAAGSVDMLHIDGQHNYEAVRQDYETWGESLSERGVVIFHDTNVRERCFGVWRLWTELSAQHPSFEFHHGHGLGVLGIGVDQPAPLRALFDLAPYGAAAAFVRRVFAARGESLVHLLRAREAAAALSARERDAQVHAAAFADQKALRERDAQVHAAALAHQRALLASVEQLAASREEHLRQLFEEILARDLALKARDTLLAGRDEAIRARDERIAAGEATVRAKAAEAANAEAAAATRAALTAQAHAETIARMEAAYLSSTSWRVTAPLRAAFRIVRRRPPQMPLFAGPLEAGVPNAAQPQSSPEHTISRDTARTAAIDDRALLRRLLAAKLAAFLSGKATMQLPWANAPDISILLVVFNQAELTLGCLESVVAVMAGCSIRAEIILVDNASTDRTHDLLERINAATVIRNNSNRHFLHGVNQAAAAARGRHLLLLNNDAQLLPGSLEAVLNVLDTETAVGAVGGRIILPDGTLQEAGSIIWNDGTCVGYGRGRDPEDPDFMFRRDVDYCSGAFLATPRTVWERLGGFDPCYGPAYYEETDYCVRLWEQDLRVVYEPEAAVLHLEFGSAGSRSEVDALQQRNWAIFRARHVEWLRKQHSPSPDNALLATRRLRPGSRRVLLIEDRVPKPELGAGYPRAHRVLRELAAAGSDVVLFPMFRHAENWAEVRAVTGPTVQVMLRAGADDLHRFLLSRREAFDGIIICRPHNMQAFLDAAGADRPGLIGHARLIYDAESVFAARAALEAEARGESIPEPSSAIAQEIALTHAADEVLSVSSGELEILRKHGVSNASLLGHALDDETTQTPFLEREGFVFLGAVPDDRSPNADSLLWFAQEVLPLLRERMGQPQLRLKVVGRVEAQAIQALDGKAFELIGQKPDLGSVLSLARVMVVPTRYAAGLPHKVHHAAILGVPMVVSELIRRQLGWEADGEVLIGSDPLAFAEACARLHAHSELWAGLRERALQRARAECSPELFRRTIRRLLAAMPAPALTNPTIEAKPRFVGRLEDEDASLAVPFGYPPSLHPGPSPRVAVICHLYHAELGAEVLSYLRNIPFTADLFLSTDTERKRCDLAAVFASWKQGEVDVRMMPNRGRDIAPKLIGFRDVHDHYEFVLHLHSKRSLHADFLTPWRGYIYETLLGSTAIVRSAFEAFARLPRLGMLAPQHFEPTRRWLDWNGNFETARAFATRMGIALRPEAALDFPSGSMFWARSAALRPVLDLNLSFKDFPRESGQQDHTPAHALERLYFHVCERAGYSWLKIADPALLFDIRAVIRIDNPQDLLRFQSEYGATLHSGVIATRSEAPPLMVRTSPGLLQRLAQRDLTQRQFEKFMA